MKDRLPGSNPSKYETKGHQPCICKSKELSTSSGKGMTVRVPGRITPDIVRWGMNLEQPGTSKKLLGKLETRFTSPLFNRRNTAGSNIQEFIRKRRVTVSRSTQ